MPQVEGVEQDSEIVALFSDVLGKPEGDPSFGSSGRGGKVVQLHREAKRFEVGHLLDWNPGAWPKE